MKCFLHLIYHPIKQSRKQKYLLSCFNFPKIENIELMLSYQNQKNRGLISLSKSLRVNSLPSSVYVLPNFFHASPHMTVILDTVNNCQAFLNAESKESSRLDIIKEVLNHPILDVGVGLPCLELRCFSLKVIGFETFYYQ